MSLIRYGAADVLEGELHAGTRGAPWSQLRLDTTTIPTGTATLAADGGLELVMSVLSASLDPYKDAVHVRLMGGAGGLSRIVPPAHYQGAQLRDPLNAILAAAGEQLSPAIDDAVLSTPLAGWSIHAIAAAAALTKLAAAAGVTWRVLADGTVWLGVESWPAEALPDGADVLAYHPAEKRYEIGVETPALMPGVALSDLDVNVGAIAHFIAPERIRTWLWAA